MKRAVAALVLVFVGCRVNVSLGVPEDVAQPSADASIAICPTTASDIEITADPALGQLRALAAASGRVVGAFSRPDGAGVVAWASSTGGAFTEVARIGADPVAIAFDGVHAYVACAASAAVHRAGVDGGPSAVATSQSAVSSVAVVSGGRAFWTRPVDDALVAWDFGEGGPVAVGVVPRAQAVVALNGSIYIAGDHRLYRLGPSDVVPTMLSPVCGGGALAASGDAIYCIDGGTLHRIDPQTGGHFALAGGIRGGRDVVTARGRVFFRAEGTSGATVEAVPIDGVGGPTIIAATELGSSALATDGCGLFYSIGSAVNRRAL